jgi:hypothetical protein
MAQKLNPASILPMFRKGPDLDGEEEAAVGLPPALASAPSAERSAPGVDLSGRPKVWLTIGPGRSGKTMLLRWAAEMIANRGGQAIYAAADPQNRSLKAYLEGVEEPPTNDAAAVTRWLDKLLRFAMEEKASALVDLGGGDTSLGRLLTEMPDLASVLETGGLAPVAMYTLGPRVDDLASLASFEAAGFQPAATALVLNEGLADPTVPREESFARILRHSAFRAAVARGVTVVWLPRLEPSVAAEIEAKRLHFLLARDGLSPEGRRVTPLGLLDRSRVRRWLDRMTEEFEPIHTWLPA